MKQNDPVGLQRLRGVLKDIALRRTKEAVELALPPREQVNEELELSAEEHQIYELCKNDTVSLIEGVIKGDASGVSVLQSILRQRQICNHGTDLLPSALRSRLERHCIEDTTNSVSVYFCEYCDQEATDDNPVQSPSEFCLHLICARCLPPSSPGADQEIRCPLCGDAVENETAGGKRKDKRRKQMSSEEWLQQLNHTYTGPSTKVKALIANLQANRLAQPPVRRYYSPFIGGSSSFKNPIERCRCSPR
jgi:SNF2 family DNA or RNA helicase